MITFSVAILILVSGYFVYGKYVSKLFGVNENRRTPAYTHFDGIDYVPLATWKAYMIQFLNIAGLGPIFGAIMGAKFGTASFLWIVFGTIFAGGVHDFLSGMLSLRHNGLSYTEIVRHYMGNGIGHVVTLFTILLMILVGVVFVSQPADLLALLTPQKLDGTFWLVVIFIYYLLATLFPIDKIIGRIYPIFAFALLFMALGILIALYVHHPAIPEIWTGFGQKYDSNPIFPMMFISIACGAISGFHATQSPLMARCIRNEKNGRFVFYGAMVSEGIVALVWAAAATAYFQSNGAADGASVIVMNISKQWLGIAGGVLAVLGVIAAPITSGDTALRTVRLIIADLIHVDQKSLVKRIAISVPIFLIVASIVWYNIKQPENFAIIWRYFSWSNQVLSVITLWTLTVFLVLHDKNYYITIIPALWMTNIVVTYICIAPEGFGFAPVVSYIIGAVIMIDALLMFIHWRRYRMKKVGEKL